MISAKIHSSSSIMNVIIRSIVKASKGLLRDFNELENLQVSIKNNNDFVTNADIKSDRVLKEELLHARPTYSLISEESQEIVGSEPNYKWIIDPLDGTVNYMHGFPHWALSVALQKDDEIVAAVTYDPIKNEMFCAEKGMGAYLNDKKIRISGRKAIADALISVRSLTDDEMKKFSVISASVRRTGCATLNMAYLAAGRFDLVYCSIAPNLWDIASGMLLVKEAGGVLADKDGIITDDYRNLSIMTNVHLLHAVSKM